MFSKDAQKVHRYIVSVSEEEAGNYKGLERTAGATG